MICAASAVLLLRCPLRTLTTVLLRGRRTKLKACLSQNRPMFSYHSQPPHPNPPIHPPIEAAQPEGGGASGPHGCHRPGTASHDGLIAPLERQR